MKDKRHKKSLKSKKTNAKIKEEFYVLINEIHKVLTERPLQDSEWKFVIKGFAMLLEEVTDTCEINQGKEPNFSLEIKQRLLQTFEKEEGFLILSCPNTISHSLEILHRISILYYKLGQTKEAFKVRKKLLKSIVQVLKDKSTTQSDFNELENCLSIFTYWNSMTQVEFTDFRYEHKMYQRMIKHASENGFQIVLFLMCSAQISMLQKDYKQALTENRQALKNASQNNWYKSYILYQIGICHQKLDNNKYVAATFRKCKEVFDVQEKLIHKVVTSEYPAGILLTCLYYKLHLKLTHIRYEKGDQRNEVKEDYERICYIFVDQYSTTIGSYSSSLIIWKYCKSDLELAKERLEYHYSNLTDDSVEMSDEEKDLLSMKLHRYSNVIEEKQYESSMGDLCSILDMHLMVTFSGKLERNVDGKKLLTVLFMKFAEKLHNLGFEYEAMKFAEKAYRCSTNIQGTTSDILKLLVDSQLKFNLIDEALEILNIAKERRKTVVDKDSTDYDIAEYFFKAGDFETAAEILQELNQDDKNSELIRTKSHLCLGKCYYELGNLHESLYHLTQAISNHEGKSEKITKDYIRVHIARSLIALGRHQKAIDILNHANPCITKSTLKFITILNKPLFKDVVIELLWYFEVILGLIPKELLPSGFLESEPNLPKAEDLYKTFKEEVLHFCPDAYRKDFLDHLVKESRCTPCREQCIMFRQNYYLSQIFQRPKKFIEVEKEYKDENDDKVGGTDKVDNDKVDNEVNNDKIGDDFDSETSQSSHCSKSVSDLDKVTDFAADKEVKYSMDTIMQINKLEEASKVKHANDLSKVQIKQEDVDLIVTEMEISEAKAEQVLRENDGDVVKSLTFLTN